MSSLSATSHELLSFVYKLIEDCPINVDIYPPAPANALSQNAFAKPPRLPAVIYFHGGALTVGNRSSWFPVWLHRTCPGQVAIKRPLLSRVSHLRVACVYNTPFWTNFLCGVKGRVVSSGMVFISVDYRLIPPATGHDILADVKDLLTFLHRDVNDLIRGSIGDQAFKIDSNAIAVAGSSAGALCAYLAAMHASPKPKVVLSLYGMGGDMLTWQYLATKPTPFFRGREMLDPAEFSDFLYPDCQRLSPTSDSPLAYHPPTYHMPGYPANPRQLLGRLYLQLGTFLDYYTGAHEPSLSSFLRDMLARDGRLTQHSDTCNTDAGYSVHIPAEHHHLFPQFNVDSNFPPTFLIHGSADTAVSIRESQDMYARLKSSGVRSELRVVEGKEHNFDYDAKAEDEFGQPGGVFEQAIDFLKEHLLRAEKLG